MVPDEATSEVRLALLPLSLVKALFELTWSLRAFDYGSVPVGAMPGLGEPGGRALAEAASRVLDRAARHLDTGLRSYFSGLAALA